MFRSLKDKGSYFNNAFPPLFKFTGAETKMVLAGTLPCISVICLSSVLRLD